MVKVLIIKKTKVTNIIMFYFFENKKGLQIEALL